MSTSRCLPPQLLAKHSLSQRLWLHRRTLFPASKATKLIRTDGGRSNGLELHDGPSRPSSKGASSRAASGGKGNQQNKNPARKTTACRYYAIAGNQWQILINVPLALIPRLRALPQTSVLGVTPLLTTASRSHMTRIRTSPSLMPEDDRLAMTIFPRLLALMPEDDRLAMTIFPRLRALEKPRIFQMSLNLIGSWAG